MMLRRPILVMAASVAAFLSTSLAVAPASAQTSALVAVAYNDLNLGTQAGRDVFDRRIDNAARLVCGDYMLRIASLAAYHSTCRAQVIGAGMARRDAIFARQRVALASRTAS